jgi:glycosyltransferase involved in cell wall biosynthesis
MGGDSVVNEISLDITIPVLNEEKRLIKGVTETLSFLQNTSIKDYQITIADNGSTDKTELIANELVSQHPDVLRFIQVKQKGVGLALRNSWGSSTKDVIGYMDVDLATDLQHIQEAYDKIRIDQVDVVNGSRLLKGSEVINRTIVREITSRGFNFLLQQMLGVNFSDGMCGFKFLKRSIYKNLILTNIETDGWFFCAEILVKASWLGMNVQEIPVKWTDDNDSRVKLVSLSSSYLKEILRLRRERKTFAGII